MKKKKKVLIVDDSELNRELLTDILEENYEVECACDGKQAIDILSTRSGQFSLVLLDIVMPKVDGFGVLKMMNEKKIINKLPVILISVEYSLEHIDRAYELGVSDFISRPFDASVVIRRIENTIMLYAGADDDDSGIRFMTLSTDDDMWGDNL